MTIERIVLWIMLGAAAITYAVFSVVVGAGILQVLATS